MYYKETLGFISLLLALAGYAPYIRDILTRKTKPHAFSWLVWAMLSGIAFAVQIQQNGGPGAWLMGFTMSMTFTIFLLSLKHGEKRIAFVDWLSLSFAFIALTLWFLTNKPLLSILLISAIDAIGGFLPTFRKSFHSPHEETEILYVLYALSLGLSLLALRSFTLINALYPAVFVAINLSMVVFLRIRKKSVL